MTGVTVVVPTRDRSGIVARTLESILADADHLERVQIVDQSRDGRTRDALAPWLGDSRVHYLASESRGLAAALNHGLTVVTSDVVAITGDDCEPCAGWLDHLCAAFAAEPHAAVVFGGVLPAAHDAAAGFVQSYAQPKRECARRAGELHRIGGTSACMGIRSAAWRRLRGFDPLLGVGAPLQAGEDVDFALRALHAGFVVCEEPDVAVVHHGFLSWEALPELIRRNWFGTGAVLAKLVRLQPGAGARVAAGMTSSWLRRSEGVAGSFGGGARLPRLIAFARGFATGLRQPLDRASGHFIPAAR
jgi:GT2 family glycosyltransferase